MEYTNIQRFHGLLIKYLQPIWRSYAIKFIENEFKDHFIIATHLRFGNGEQFNKFDRELPNIHEIIDEFIIVLLKFIENYNNNDNNNNNNNKINLSNIKIFVASDTYHSIDYFANK